MPLLSTTFRRKYGSVPWRESPERCQEHKHLVAVFRELERFVLEFVAACLNADGKVMNLVAGIVVVKLTRDRPALTLEHTREDIA